MKAAHPPSSPPRADAAVTPTRPGSSTRNGSIATTNFRIQSQVDDSTRREQISCKSPPPLPPRNNVTISYVSATASTANQDRAELFDYLRALQSRHNVGFDDQVQQELAAAVIPSVATTGTKHKLAVSDIAIDMRSPTKREAPSATGATIMAAGHRTISSDTDDTDRALLEMNGSVHADANAAIPGTDESVEISGGSHFSSRRTVSPPCETSETDAFFTSELIAIGAALTESIIQKEKRNRKRQQKLVQQQHNVNSACMDGNGTEGLLCYGDDLGQPSGGQQPVPVMSPSSIAVGRNHVESVQDEPSSLERRGQAKQQTNSNSHRDSDDTDRENDMMEQMEELDRRLQELEFESQKQASSVASVLSRHKTHLRERLARGSNQKYYKLSDHPDEERAHAVAPVSRGARVQKSSSGQVGRELSNEGESDEVEPLNMDLSFLTEIRDVISAIDTPETHRYEGCNDDDGMRAVVTGSDIKASMDGGSVAAVDETCARGGGKGAATKLVDEPTDYECHVRELIEKYNFDHLDLSPPGAGEGFFVSDTDDSRLQALDRRLRELWWDHVDIPQTVGGDFLSRYDITRQRLLLKLGGRDPWRDSYSKKAVSQRIQVSRRRRRRGRRSRPSGGSAAANPGRSVAASIPSSSAVHVSKRRHDERRSIASMQRKSQKRNDAVPATAVKGSTHSSPRVSQPIPSPSLRSAVTRPRSAPRRQHFRDLIHPKRRMKEGANVRSRSSLSQRAHRLPALEEQRSLPSTASVDKADPEDALT